MEKYCIQITHTQCDTRCMKMKCTTGNHNGNGLRFKCVEKQKSGRISDCEKVKPLSPFNDVCSLDFHFC